jgi:hypothetical protein
VATVRDRRSPPDGDPIAAAPSGRVTRAWLGYFGWLTARAGGLVTVSTVDPPSLAAGASAAVSVTVTGAREGQWALATFDAMQAGVSVRADVVADDTVSVTFTNLTGGGAIDLASGTLRVRVGSMT